MKLGKYGALLHYGIVKLGDFIANEFILIEIKCLGSIKFYRFKGNMQDRYHTHAYNSISFRVYGSYTERRLTEDLKTYTTHDRDSKRLIFIPRNRFHSITESKGCLTLVITGPWRKEWKEFKFKTNKIYTYNWGRKHAN